MTEDLETVKQKLFNGYLEALEEINLVYLTKIKVSQFIFCLIRIGYLPRF